jgi:hypothetical protein
MTFGGGNRSFAISGQNTDIFFDPPKFDCGMEQLQVHPKSKRLLAGIGNVADAVQQLFDYHMENTLHLPKQQDTIFHNVNLDDFIWTTLM